MTKPAQWKTTEVQLLKKMSESMTVREAAKKLGRSYQSVYSKSTEMGFELRADNSNRERKFFADDAAKIFELKGLGLCSSEIGAYLGIDKRTVRTIASKAARFGFEAYPLRENKQ